MHCICHEKPAVIQALKIVHWAHHGEAPRIAYVNNVNEIPRTYRLSCALIWQVISLLRLGIIS